MIFLPRYWDKSMGAPARELTVKLKKEVLSIGDVWLVDVVATGRSVTWLALKQAVSSGRQAMPKSRENVFFMSN